MSALKLTGIPTTPRTSDRASKLLSSYRFNMDRGSSAVREMILQDIRRFSEMGAEAYVADLRKALFRFDDETCKATSSPAAYHRSNADALEVGM